jgi:hypothetical protein
MRPDVPAGYSGKPLAAKLGITEDAVVAAVAAPPEYPQLLQPLPRGARLVTQATNDVKLVHLFVTRRAKLEGQLARLRKVLPNEVAVWVSWPKRAAKVQTDITEDIIREVALPLDYVDVKVCAVSEVWSGLKLVVRKSLR